MSDAFRAAMRRAGLDYAGPILADGKLHRFKAEGDKARNSWFVLHADPPAAGAFGCWRRGINEKWCERGVQLSQTEWDTVRRRWQEAERERERTITERHAKARKTAAWLLSRAAPVQPAHPYLVAKGVQAHGDLRQRGAELALPLRDADGNLHSMQFIAPDKRFDGERDKSFLSGGRIAGCYFTIADKPDGPLVIAEGYATGASIHEATGFATVCALNCGNLKAVAEALRAKSPERDIILSADDDQWTDGNPGVTKATEAAKAIRARLTFPHFQDTTTKPTDFNDLHQLEGLVTVKEQIESAGTPKESDDDIITRLAALPPLAYERQRDAEANNLGVRVSVLDGLVNDKRPKSGSQDDTLQGQSADLAEVEPWPEPVNGAEVLAEVATTFTRYAVLPAGAGDALALWCAHAHAFRAFLCSPRLNIFSPEKRCGKTTLRDVVAVFVPRPLLTENLSVAVLFRLVDDKAPTILADEYDAWMRDNDELRGMLNSGHRRGGMAYRCEGDNHEVRGFRVHAPVVLCGIGPLPGTLHDRSIVIPLERAKPGELHARFDSRHMEPEHELCRKLARWCADNSAALEASDPTLPSGAFNRQADNWRPLFAVAEQAGGDWPGRAAAAYAKLTATEDVDAQGIGAALLADIRQVFTDAEAEHMFSKKLVESLCALTDRPWPEAHKGRQITEAWLARRLRSFGVVSRNIRHGTQQAKGYAVEDFAEVFERYLPTQGPTKRPSVPTPENIDVASHSEASQPEIMGRLENTVSVNNDKPWDAGTDGMLEAGELVAQEMLL
jgi:putative DNA primase/helicase